MARRGKIARLPHTIREELNQRLLDGQTGPKILPWLNALPEVQAVLRDLFHGEAINADNLSAWRNGGFEEWVSRRENAERLGVLSQASVQLAQASGGTLADGAAQLLATEVHILLEELDALRSDLRQPRLGGLQKVEELAEMMDKLSLAVLRLRKGDLDAEQLKINRKELEQEQRAFELRKQKFQWEACRMLLRAAEDNRVQAIASSPASYTQKIEQLGALLFGDDWSHPQGGGENVS